MPCSEQCLAQGRCSVWKQQRLVGPVWLALTRLRLSAYGHCQGFLLSEAPRRRCVQPLGYCTQGLPWAASGCAGSSPFSPACHIPVLCIPVANRAHRALQRACGASHVHSSPHEARALESSAWGAYVERHWLQLAFVQSALLLLQQQFVPELCPGYTTNCL